MRGAGECVRAFMCICTVSVSRHARNDGARDTRDIGDSHSCADYSFHINIDVAFHTPLPLRNEYYLYIYIYVHAWTCFLHTLSTWVACIGVNTCL